jgi:hypothetical protein
MVMMVRVLLGAFNMVLVSRVLTTIAVLFAALVSVCMTFSDIADASTHEPRPNGGLWVTFDVEGERFRAVVTRPDAIEYVLGYVAGNQPVRAPIGEVKADNSFNAPWSWSLAPESVAFTDEAIESCDGMPAMVEQNLERWLADIQRYCPWKARIAKVHDCRDGECKPLRGLYAGRSPAF